MYKTKTNKGFLIIGTLLMMLVMAFVPALVSLSTPSVKADDSYSMTAELSDDQKTITVTLEKNGEPVANGNIKAEITEGDAKGETLGTNGTITVSNGTATIAINDPDKVGLVKITYEESSKVVATVSVTVNIAQLDWYKGTVQPVIKILGTVVPILLTLVGTAGAIFIVILSVNYSKAEDSSKREEARKRLIGTIIGVVLMLALLIVVTLFTNYAPSIIRWIKGLSKTEIKRHTTYVFFCAMQH